MTEKAIRPESPTIDVIGEVCDVYWHFRKKCFSVRHKGKVKHHVNKVVMHNAEFRVSEKGNERVRREGRKNVHAVIRGSVSYIDQQDDPLLKPYKARLIKYNPYKHKTFVDQNGDPVYEAKAVVCSVQNGVFASWE